MCSSNNLNENIVSNLLSPRADEYDDDHFIFFVKRNRRLPSGLEKELDIDVFDHSHRISDSRSDEDVQLSRNSTLGSEVVSSTNEDTNKIDEFEHSTSGDLSNSQNGVTERVAESDDELFGESFFQLDEKNAPELGHGKHRSHEKPGTLTPVDAIGVSVAQDSFVDQILRAEWKSRNVAISNDGVLSLTAYNENRFNGTTNFHESQDETEAPLTKGNPVYTSNSNTEQNFQNVPPNEKVCKPNGRSENRSCHTFGSETNAGGVFDECLGVNTDEKAWNLVHISTDDTTIQGGTQSEAELFERMVPPSNMKTELTPQFEGSNQNMVYTTTGNRDAIESGIVAFGEIDAHDHFRVDALEAFALDNAYCGNLVEPFLASNEGIERRNNGIQEVGDLNSVQIEGIGFVEAAQSDNLMQFPGKEVENYINKDENILVKVSNPISISTGRVVENTSVSELKISEVNGNQTVQCVESTKTVVETTQQGTQAQEMFNSEGNTVYPDVPMVRIVGELTKSSRKIALREETLCEPKGQTNEPTSLKIKENKEKPNIQDIVVRGVDYTETYIVKNGVPCVTAVKCDQCGHFFYNKKHLKNHKAVAHCSGGKYVCGVCKITYTSNSNLECHVGTVHREDAKEKMRCKEEGCSAWFNTQRQLKVHERKMHGAHLHKNAAARLAREKQNKRSYICAHCCSVLSTKTLATKHVLKFHPKNTNITKRKVGTNSDATGCNKRTKK